MSVRQNTLTQLGVRITEPSAPQVVQLTAGGRSYIEVWNTLPEDAQLSPTAFDTLWDKHPQKRNLVRVYGKNLEERRWSASYMRGYRYSGHEHPPRDTSVPPELVPLWLWVSSKWPSMNQCLVNWYHPSDHIGSHSDDEASLVPGQPILSVSYGATRTFRVKSKRTPYTKPGTVSVRDFKTGNNTMFVMGGTMQKTHKHEIVPLGKRAQESGGNRINVTFRAFK